MHAVHVLCFLARTNHIHVADSHPRGKPFASMGYILAEITRYNSDSDMAK